MRINKQDFIFIIIAIFIVIITEMLNTAIEAVVDLSVQEYNKKAKIAKDVAAGAVVLASINAVIIGILVFFVK